MSKLLFLTLEFSASDSDAGGVGRMYHDLCRAMPSHQVVVWTPPRPEVKIDPASLTDDTFTVRRAPLLATRGWPRWLPAVTRVGEYLDYLRTDKLVIGQILPLGIVAWLLKQQRSICYGIFVHGMDISQPMHVLRRRWLMRKILKNADVVFAANKYVAVLVQKLGVSADRIIVVYPSPSLRRQPDARLLDNLRCRYAIDEVPILLTVGRLVKRKGHDIVLRALDIVWRELPQTRYIIVGSGPELSRLQGLASGLSRPENVAFVGQLPDDDVAGWFTLATVFIMTPRTMPDGDVEGLGMVYLEAAKFRKPSIATRSGGVGEAVLDGETGLLVPEDDVEATARAILSLLKDADLRQAMGERASERIERDFSARRGANSIILALENAANRQGPPNN